MPMKRVCIFYEMNLNICQGAAAVICPAKWLDLRQYKQDTKGICAEWKSDSKLKPRPKRNSPDELRSESLV